MSKEAGWYDDPVLDGRQRYWNGNRWTSHVSINGDQYEETYLGNGHVRWQYGVVNIGMFNAPGRMQAVLAEAGQHGWELINVYDKQSNWLAGMEKGFMLLKRPVAPGERLDDEEWCINLSLT